MFNAQEVFGDSERLVEYEASQNDSPALTGVMESKPSSMNVYESEEDFLFTADLTGCDRKDMDVRFGCGALIISGLRKSGYWDSEEKSEEYVHFDRPIQTGGIKAWFENEMLTVRLPKAEKMLFEV